MDYKQQFKGIQFFWKGLKAAKEDMWASVQVLFIATIVLGVLLCIVEPNFHWYDGFLWSFMKYLGNPGKFSPDDPVTIVGRYIWIVISVIQILIFAVPAGLVANGFREAMAKDKREEKLNKFRKRMHKAVRRSANKTRREYLNTLPDKGGEKFKSLNFVPRRCTVAKMQVRQGMSLQDIIDTALKFPEFRLKTLASAMNEEDAVDDRFVVEMSPINRSYGCCINRNSRVTIVSTSGFDEVGTSWFTYYLAKFGGFNYISKEVEIDSDELDSFLNMKPEPLCDFKPRSFYEEDEKKYKQELEIIDHKQKNRDSFLNDLKTLAEGNDSPWVIVITEHIKNSSNNADFHFGDKDKAGKRTTVIDTETYDKLYEVFSDVMRKDLQLEAVKTTRYPNQKNNLLYRLQDDKAFPQFNGFVLRPSSQLMTFDSHRLLIAFRMAQVIADVLAPGSTLLDCEKSHFAAGFGYAEQDVENQDIYVLDR